MFCSTHWHHQPLGWEPLVDPLVSGTVLTATSVACRMCESLGMEADDANIPTRKSTMKYTVTHLGLQGFSMSSLNGTLKHVFQDIVFAN